MLFAWENVFHQVLLVILLASSAIIAIIINRADLTGKKKYTLFKFIHRVSLAFYIPAGIFLLVLNLLAIGRLDYITLSKSATMAIIAITGLLVLMLSTLRLAPLSKEGMHEMRKKSITASKYQKLFQKLRSSFITIMVSVVIAYWLMYLTR